MSDREDDMIRFIRNPIRIPKTVRIEDAQPPEEGPGIRVTVCGRPVVVRNTNGSLWAFDLEDMPTEEERRWRGGIRPIRGYTVRLEPGALVLERTWGYADERPPFKLSVEPPTDAEIVSGSALSRA